MSALALEREQAARIEPAENRALELLARAQGDLLRAVQALPPSHCSIFRAGDSLVLTNAVQRLEDVLHAAEAAQQERYEARSARERDLTRRAAHPSDA